MVMDMKVFKTYEELMLYLLKNYDVSIPRKVKKWLMSVPIHAVEFRVSMLEGVLVIERVSYIWQGSKAIEYVERKLFPLSR